MRSVRLNNHPRCAIGSSVKQVTSLMYRGRDVNTKDWPSLSPHAFSETPCLAVYTRFVRGVPRYDILVVGVQVQMLGASRC